MNEWMNVFKSSVQISLKECKTRHSEDMRLPSHMTEKNLLFTLLFLIQNITGRQKKEKNLHPLLRGLEAKYWGYLKLR